MTIPYEMVDHQSKARRSACLVIGPEVERREIPSKIREEIKQISHGSSIPSIFGRTDDLFMSIRISL